MNQDQQFPLFKDANTNVGGRPAPSSVRWVQKPSLEDKLHCALRELPPQKLLLTPKQAGYVPRNYGILDRIRKSK